MNDLAGLARIRQLLNSGLETDWRHRPRDSEEVAALTARLEAIDDDDLERKLVTAGFLPTPYVPSDGETEANHACVTCIYYETHKKFCSAPALMLPVLAQWSCALWRM